jgi:serine/threonine protein kinase
MRIKFLHDPDLGQYREAAVFLDFFGWFKKDLYVYLAMEYLPLGDLEKYLSEMYDAGKVPQLGAQQITTQILLGLKIMFAGSFAHRDLKPQVMTTIDIFLNNYLVI